MAGMLHYHPGDTYTHRQSLHSRWHASLPSKIHMHAKAAVVALWWARSTVKRHMHTGGRCSAVAGRLDCVISRHMHTGDHCSIVLNCVRRHMHMLVEWRARSTRPRDTYAAVVAGAVKTLT